MSQRKGKRLTSVELKILPYTHPLTYRRVDIWKRQSLSLQIAVRILCKKSAEPRHCCNVSSDSAENLQSSIHTPAWFLLLQPFEHSLPHRAQADVRPGASPLLSFLFAGQLAAPAESRSPPAYPRGSQKGYLYAL